MGEVKSTRHYKFTPPSNNLTNDVAENAMAAVVNIGKVAIVVMVVVVVAETAATFETQTKNAVLCTLRHTLCR